MRARRRKAKRPRPAVHNRQQTTLDHIVDDSWTVIDGRRYFIAGYTPNGVPYGIFEGEVDPVRDWWGEQGQISVHCVATSAAPTPNPASS